MDTQTIDRPETLAPAPSDAPARPGLPRRGRLGRPDPRRTRLDNRAAPSWIRCGAARVRWSRARHFGAGRGRGPGANRIVRRRPRGCGVGAVKWALSWRDRFFRMTRRSDSITSETICGKGSVMAVETKRYFFGLTNLNVMRSLSPMAAYLARSLSPSSNVGGRVQTPKG